MKPWGWMVLGLLWGMPSVEAIPVLVCERPDGTLAIVYPVDPPNQTPKIPGELQNFICVPKVHTDLPPNRARREAWRWKADGTIWDDPAVTTTTELNQAKRTAARAKLKGLGLTDEDLAALNLP